MATQKNTFSLAIPNRKQIRARVIADFMGRAGYRGAVCFSCGNASRALKLQGLYVVDISPEGDLTPARWWTPAEIRRAWPDLFDATSGHLPMPLMMDFARALRDELGELPPAECYQVPTGSGETITCLRWAYPDLHFVAVYNQGRPTQFEKKAPLNLAVAAMGPIQYHPAPVSPESKKISC